MVKVKIENIWKEIGAFLKSKNETQEYLFSFKVTVKLYNFKKLNQIMK